MKCEKIEEILSLYLENEISPEEKMMIENHIKECARCSTLFSFLKEAKESLTDFPELEVSENLMNRLYALPSKKKKLMPSFDFLLRPSLQPVFAVATVFLIMISFYFFNPDKKFIDKSISRQIHLGYNKVEKLYAKAESLTDNLDSYKDSLLTSLKDIKIFGRNED